MGFCELVYRYKYDETMQDHGCVLVQYKSNISWTGTARDAEWSPIMRTQRTMNIGDGDGDAEPVECNVSKPKGVRFVSKPPDLRKHPRREPFDHKSEKHKPDKVCETILKKRADSLSPASISFWKCLAKLHARHGEVAERVPDMPHTIDTEGHSFAFDGLPRPFVDVMKAIYRRFPRPFLHSDPFTAAPPASWDALSPAVPMSAPAPQEEEGEACLRDPRRENSVGNLELTEAEQRAALRSLAEDEFAESVPARVERVELDELHLCELEKAEHGLRLGLALPEEKGPVNKKGHPTFTVAWFQIASKNGWQAKNISFVPYNSLGGVRQKDSMDLRSFRLRVDDVYLTKGARTTKRSTPRFTAEFTHKVLAFARSERLDDHDSEDEIAQVESDDEDEAEEEPAAAVDESEDEGSSSEEEHPRAKVSRKASAASSSKSAKVQKPKPPARPGTKKVRHITKSVSGPRHHPPRSCMPPSAAQGGEGSSSGGKASGGKPAGSEERHWWQRCAARRRRCSASQLPRTRTSCRKICPILRER